MASASIFLGEKLLPVELFSVFLLIIGFAVSFVYY
jgi:hypothetical protein